MPLNGVDNDILLKGAAYGLLRELTGAIPTEPEEIAVLGSARFSVPIYLKRVIGAEQAAAKAAELQSLFEVAIVLEPNDAELGLAAEFEFMSQREQLSLDNGESQLFAMLGSGRLAKVASGDKRAAISLRTILEKRGTPKNLSPPSVAPLDSRYLVL